MQPEKPMPLWDEARFNTPQAKAWAQAVSEKNYKALNPWRKGPFKLGDVEIDGEWRCDLKWDRLLPILPNLKDKTILDIGCNNGYFMFRMAEHAPKSVVGIDPSAIYRFQFQAIQNSIQAKNISFFPIGFEDIQSLNQTFDIIFCMGILYHHPDPSDILKRCLSVLNPGGTLVIETLILDKPGNHILRPKPTYAKMKNVYEIPTPEVLKRWMVNAGFSGVKCHDKTLTTSEEQRVTEWSSQKSLADFLDATDVTKTGEGYPAPVRAILTGQNGFESR